MNDQSSALSTCRTLQNQGACIPNATTEDIKRALIRGYENDPEKFITMTERSLWNLVIEELNKVESKDC